MPNIEGYVTGDSLLLWLSGKTDSPCTEAVKKRPSERKAKKNDPKDGSRTTGCNRDGDLRPMRTMERTGRPSRHPPETHGDAT